MQGVAVRDRSCGVPLRGAPSLADRPVGGTAPVGDYIAGRAPRRPPRCSATRSRWPRPAFFAVNGTVSTLALEAGIAADPADRAALHRRGAGPRPVLAVVSPRRLRITWREVPFLAVFGVVGVALTQYLYYVAIGLMPVGIALVFEMTAPVFIALYVWLVRHEKVRSRLWAALLLSLSGLVLVAEVWQDGGSLNPLGVGAALVAALCLATYYLMGERGTVTRDPVTLTCWSFVAAAVFWSVAAPWWQFDVGLLGERVPVSIGSVELPLWVLVAWIVVLGAMVPFWLSIAGAAAPRARPRPAWWRRSSRCSPRSSPGCGSSRCSAAGRSPAGSSSSPGSRWRRRRGPSPCPRRCRRPPPPCPA